MKGVRPFCHDDVPYAARLYSKVFGKNHRPIPGSQQDYEAHLAHVFLQHPWQHDSIRSLVHEEEGGRITGFLGVLPRPLWVRGRRLQAAVSSCFLTDPERCNPTVALKLLQTFFNGPQALSVTDEANEISRKLWEGLGGKTCFAQSTRWLCPLRLSRFVLEMIGKNGAFRPLCWASAPAAAFADAILSRFPKYPYRRPVPRLLEEPLSYETMLDHLDACSPVLRPLYDFQSLQWLFERSDRVRPAGGLRKVLLKTAGGELAGWYIYHLNPGGICESIQIFAKTEWTTHVLDHLLYRAWENGGVAVAGRMAPAEFPVFREKHVFWRAGPWMLLHSPDADLLNAFHRGDVFFSRMEGEWCCRF